MFTSKPRRYSRAESRRCAAFDIMIQLRRPRIRTRDVTRSGLRVGLVGGATVAHYQTRYGFLQTEDRLFGSQRSLKVKLGEHGFLFPDL